MKKKARAKAGRKPGARGGYRGLRDPATGRTPREELYHVQTQRQLLELAKDRGLLVPQSEVVAGLRECAEVIQSDLYGALPSRCATVLGGKKNSAERVRRNVLKIVDDIVANWVSAEVAPGEAKPE